MNGLDGVGITARNWCALLVIRSTDGYLPSEVSFPRRYFLTAASVRVFPSDLQLPTRQTVAAL
jgi:hypothetical protein